jgi:hypothetical protein
MSQKLGKLLAQGISDSRNLAKVNPTIKPTY